ncbi:MAG: GNAT family N-acetyltransferase [Burkholderiales bacterium]|nr:GNAT family N-acetyltransferase [Burkholderiales bacterium]
MDTSGSSAEFTIERANKHSSDPDFLNTWNDLLSGSQSPEAIFQTPEYFEFISLLPNKYNTQELVVIKSLVQQKIIGIVPLRTGRRTFELQVGNKIFGRLRMKTIALLGSIPLAASNPAIWNALVDFLFESFPNKDTIAMQSLPIESDFYRHLTLSQDIQSKYGIYIKDGWRNCHTTPLPSSHEAYLNQFKAKKRYNLNRQIKLLEAHSGAVHIERIDSPKKVPELMSGLRQIAKIEFIDNMMSERHYTELARKGILLCYTLSCGGKVCAIVMGIRSRTTFHIHNIIYDLKLSQFSPGASILHLITKDLIDTLRLSLIDYGYGSPEHTQQSSNIPRLRGHVFLYKKTLKNRLLFAVHAAFHALISFGKMLKERGNAKALGELQRAAHKSQ